MGRGLHRAVLLINAHQTGERGAIVAGSVYEYGAPCRTCGHHVPVFIVGPVTIPQEVANGIVRRYLETGPVSRCHNPDCPNPDNSFTAEVADRPHRILSYGVPTT